jgi:phosphoglycerol transferase MdoB-like AlkP superfamily enzyme
MGVRGRAGRRYYRTTLLGVVALGALIWVAVEQFQIAPREVAELALGALLMVVLVISAAATVALLWVGLRKLLRRGKP